MQFHLAKESNKVNAVIRYEREFIRSDSLGEFPVRLTAQTEVIDVGFKSRLMSDSDQRLMQAFIDPEPHALPGRELNR